MPDGPQTARDRAERPRDKQGQEQGQEKISEEDAELATRGWKMWTGKWKSTPIGVVANR